MRRVQAFTFDKCRLEKTDFRIPEAKGDQEMQSSWTFIEIVGCLRRALVHARILYFPGNTKTEMQLRKQRLSHFPIPAYTYETLRSNILHTL